MRFEESLNTLSEKIQTLFRNLKRRTIFVYHPCWGYFAREFGLKQIAVQHEGKNPGASALAELITAARKTHAHCIFVQPQFDVRSARILAGQIGGKVVLIDPLAEIWERNLLKVAGRIADCLER
jgi:zinc transport system substrate-binding protein